MDDSRINISETNDNIVCDKHPSYVIDQKSKSCQECNSKFIGSVAPVELTYPIGPIGPVGPVAPVEIDSPYWTNRSWNWSWFRKT